MRFSSTTLMIRPSCLVMTVMVVTACLASPTPVPTPTTAPTPEPEVDAFTMNQRLARTVNLGNALEAPSEGEWGVTLKAEFFK